MNTRRTALSAAVLISGGGSNLQALIDACHAGTLDLDISVVLSNNPAAGGLERARREKIPLEIVAGSGYADRTSYDLAVARALDRYQPGLLILAGFMRILSADFVRRYEGRILNIHPSLLPAYPGLHTHQRAIEAGEKWHGATVHFVTAELDGGPAIIQARVPVLLEDGAESLAHRVLEVEHRLYPEAAQLYAAGRVVYRRGEAYLDGNLLRAPLQL